MDRFHWVMLIFGILFAVIAPVVLVKAVQRKEWQRLFELAVKTLWASGFVLMVLWPASINNLWSSWSPLRWLWLLFPALFLLDFFGFSGWLFSRRKMRKI